MADREEAQRTRAQARNRRRGETGQRPNEPEGSSATDGDASAPRDQAIDGVKQAAKVAAASAAVGAAAAAARALTARHGEEREPQEDERESDDGERRPEELGEAAAQKEQAGPQMPQAEQMEEGPPEDVHEGRDHDEPVEGVAPDEAKMTVQRAREQLESLLERKPESVSSLERTRDGWLVTLEVVEVSRVPESTDVLASYEMHLDERGNLRRYARIRRYRRSQADDGDQR